MDDCDILKFYLFHFGSFDIQKNNRFNSKKYPANISSDLYFIWVSIYICMIKN